MNTLYEMFYNPEIGTDNFSRMNAEKIADMLLRLCEETEKGQMWLLSPETILVLSDEEECANPSAGQGGGSGLLDAEREPETPDRYYMAPEALAEGARGHVLSDGAGWFKMGMLAYFIISGRSFYQDNNKGLLETLDVWDSLGEGNLPAGTDAHVSRDHFLTFRHDGGEGNVSADGSLDGISSMDLYRSAMEQMTARDPGERFKGVRFLLEAIRRCDAAAEISYVYQDQVVGTDSKRIDSTRGLRIEAGDRAGDGVYSVAETVEIPWRPGVHKYQIPVQKQQALQSGRYLIVRIGQGRAQRIMKLGDTVQEVNIKAILDSEKQYNFFVAEPGAGQSVTVVGAFHLNLPVIDGIPTALIRVVHKPEENCFEVELYDERKVNRLSRNVKRFSI